MEMIFCFRCGTRFDPELLACPVCKAEVVPPKPDETKAKKAPKPAPTLALPALPQLPDITVNMVERPPAEGTLTGAVWLDVVSGLLGGLAVPGAVGWSVFSAMSEMPFSYLFALLLLALPVGLEIALFAYLRKRYPSFSIGLGVSAFLCLGAWGIVALLFAGSSLFMYFRS
ncbi:MAG TPA: hypothetical protein VKU00_28665 [Chthonomonadaceae bacterium]|nr:hypothetical protein [Chthonomonadaceae bacterium]